MTGKAGLPNLTMPGAIDADALAGSDAPDTYTAKTKFVGADTVATMQFSLLCGDLPAGSEVAFQFTEPNTGGSGFVNPIVLPWTKLPPPAGGKNGDMVPQFTAGLTTRVNANYDSEVIYQYRSNGYPALPGMSITMQAVFVASGES
ncbi:hypothetical protein [Hoeflea ulvae]|uniref:Uncharacterized protein n=1 Tax=Hoeflea ulvae TaxID=2983764 RepID=A0ABT3YGJ4_9HYPH|nr:hypothetical protein [Hoeflea ulvae]MCY0094904.1 hypothetical protein [Hoeflea ulvae]